ncbi:MAG: hypothetical protein JNL01_08770 [Bdellovibrionales bacterium]|nr:hypothetical protein [Bdellovibrionales bacterium]
MWSRAVAVLSFLVFFSGGDVWAKNLGHRVGAGKNEFHKDLPENSIVALNAAVTKDTTGQALQDHPDFRYCEFDVQETADHQLVLFHDESLVRMLPDQEFNRAAIEMIITDPKVKKRVGKKKVEYKDLETRHLTLAQIQSLRFGEKWKAGPVEGVPTLKDFLDAAMSLKLAKPIGAEVKLLYSDQGKNEYIRLLENYRNLYALPNPPKQEKGYDMSADGVSVLAGKVAFRRTFGRVFTRKRKTWCQTLSKHGFKFIYRTGAHSENHCR